MIHIFGHFSASKLRPSLTFGISKTARAWFAVKNPHPQLINEIFFFQAMAVVVVTAGAVTIIQVATMVSTEGLLVMVITTEVDEDAEITVNVDSEPAVKVAEEIG